MKQLERNDDVLSMVSHDLKSPMQAVLGYSRLLVTELDNCKADERAYWILDRITTAGNHVVEMIDSILSIAKLEAGREPIDPAEVANLRRELAVTLHTFEMEAKAKGITIGLNIEEGLPTPVWDMSRLRLHVLNNLISNSLKFTPEGGRISLSAVSMDGSIMLEVADNGPGIPDEELDRVFRKYTQSPLRTKRSMEGAGLGLYNARLFVERHGGTIEADNNAYGRGAIFKIWLPLNATQTEEAEAI